MSRQPFSMRQWATAVGIAIFTPAAVLALVAIALVVLSAWGYDARIPGGTAAEQSTITGLVCLAVAVAMACWWIWLCVAHGAPIWKGLLATIPLVGVIWGLRIGAGIAQGRYLRRSVSRRVVFSLIAVTCMTIILLPLAMSEANAAMLAEQDRRAASCLDTALPTVEGSAQVATAGSDRIAGALVDELSSSIASIQLGVLDRRASHWQPQVLQALILASLARKTGIEGRVKVSVGEAEDRADAWAELGAYANVRRDVALFLSCASLVSETLGARVLKDASQVTLTETYGFWNPKEGKIQETPLAEGAGTAAVGPPADRIFDVRVAYDGVNIADQTFNDTLSWATDLCVGVPELLQSSVASRVGLYQRVAGQWQKVSKPTVSVTRGGRCTGGQVNLRVGAAMPEPEANWTDKDWQTCRAYQVRIPETSTFRATSVDVCVSARAKTKGAAA